MALYKAKTKYPGTQPALGRQSNGKLKTCDYALNCFSTSGDDAHLLPLWKPRAGASKGEAMAELLQTIKSYPPGQAGVGMRICVYAREQIHFGAQMKARFGQGKSNVSQKVV